MKAIVFRRHGGREVLEHADLPEPAVSARGVRIRVKAVALNHLDVWVRRGWAGLKVEFPHVLGSDVAGVVESVGSEVTGLTPGTEVMLNPGLSCGVCEKCLVGDDNLCRSYKVVGEHTAGGYADLLSVPRANVVVKPPQLSFEQAASIPLTFLTAWTMLARRANVQPGETVLVQAAGSGVGSAAVQIAKLLGARVIATASTDEKLAKARELGADETINYKAKDFVQEVKRLTDRKLVDVVFEHVGGEVFEKSVACLPYGGRLVTCGASMGHAAQLDLRVLFYKRISLLGSTMGSKGDLFRILQLVSEGKLKGIVDRPLPLADASEGHRLLEERATFGKIVLIP